MKLLTITMTTVRVIEDKFYEEWEHGLVKLGGFPPEVMQTFRDKHKAEWEQPDKRVTTFMEMTEENIQTVDNSSEKS